VLAIKEIPTTEGRNAELALWRRRPDDAERILLQAKLVFRAIDMNMRLFNWCVPAVPCPPAAPADARLSPRALAGIARSRWRFSTRRTSTRFSGTASATSQAWAVKRIMPSS